MVAFDPSRLAATPAAPAVPLEHLPPRPPPLGAVKGYVLSAAGVILAQSQRNGHRGRLSSFSQQRRRSAFKSSVMTARFELATPR